jgi:hypothetical protein
MDPSGTDVAEGSDAGGDPRPLAQSDRLFKIERVDHLGSWNRPDRV